MNKTIFIIAISLASIIGLGYFLTSTNLKFKTFIENIGIIPAPKVVIPDTYNAVFVIFDPSGSGRSTYSVPRITANFIDQLIASIEEKGSGDLWLTFISRSAYNNDVLHFEIPKKPEALEAPIRQSGERLGDFKSRLKKFQVEFSRNAVKMKENTKSSAKKRNVFLKVCQNMIDKAYGPKKPGQDYSDIIGSVNSALRVFSTITPDSTHFRSVLLVSDGIQDVPRTDPHETLSPIPHDVRFIEVNHSGSRQDLFAGRALEISDLNRSIEKTVRVYKPLK